MIVLYHEERQRFECLTSYFERSIPKENRWRWDNRPGIARWYTSDPDIARRLAAYAQGSAAVRLTSLSDNERQAILDSQAHDAPPGFEIACPPGLAYLPYQRAGIFYALGRRGTLIADEMGLGKTIEAIGVVNAFLVDSRDRQHDLDHVPSTPNLSPSSRRVLIVCPASLRLNWHAEWRRWHTGPLRPVLLDEWPGGLFGQPKGVALIVSYDSVYKWHPMIAAEPWDLLICDEIHLCKDEGARRTRALLGGRYKGKTFQPIKAHRKLFLTGTPIVNKAKDLWPLVHALAPQGFGASRADYFRRYDQDGMLDELHLRLRASIMVRRKKGDVEKDLPPKRRQIILLDVPGAAGILAAEGRAISLAQAMVEKTRSEIAGLPHGEQVMRLRQCRSIAMAEISRVRKETAVAKLPQAIEHIHDVIGNVPKVVVFAHHHEVLDGLRAALPRISTGFDGRTPLEERQAAVDRFQTDPRYRVFVGSKAAGLGVTLTAAAVALFVELQWTAADMDQEESRIHRIGQREPCLFQHLVIDGSIDAKMARIIIAKQAIMDAALDGGPPETRNPDILEEVMRQ